MNQQDPLLYQKHQRRPRQLKYWPAESDNEQGWIGVDLDGTLAEYEYPRDLLQIGPPVELMVRRVKRWLQSGVEVRIFTARIDGGRLYHGEIPSSIREVYEQVIPIITMIEAWCLEHIGQVLPITNIKDSNMKELWDDRVVQVERNTGRILDGEWRDLE